MGANPVPPFISIAVRGVAPMNTNGCDLCVLDLLHVCSHSALLPVPCNQLGLALLGFRSQTRAGSVKLL